MEVTVSRPGLLSTIQDLGRPGLRQRGVTAGGAMDPLSLRLANLLVGNPPNSPAIEMTLRGAELQFDQPALVAICGGDFESHVDGVAISNARPFGVKRGSTLTVTAARRGCRAYLAIAGGFIIESCLGGRGTDLRAGIGGVDGRALQSGDVLAGREVKFPKVPDGWFLADDWRADLSGRVALRALHGQHADEFTSTVFDHEFEISPQSDRMGLRLNGPTLSRATGDELLSTAVMPGTVQIPPDGHPIVLAADCQTIGGYPRGAHVITADLPTLGQLCPGDSVRFVEVDLVAARGALVEQELNLRLLRIGLASRLPWVRTDGCSAWT
jgi:antagonist of KipI